MSSPIVVMQSKQSGSRVTVFAAPVKIGSVSYYEAVVVIVETDKNTYYLHEVALQKKKSAETSQILNVPATTPKAKASQTSTNSISDNSEKINTKNEKFQLSDTVEETKDLVAVHNLSESKLMKALELGGMPMPSIVVMQSKQSGSRVTVFGEVYVNGNEPVLAVLELAPSKNNILINQVKIASAYKKTMPKTLSIRVKSYILIVTKKSCSMVTVYWAPIAGQLAKLQL